MAKMRRYENSSTVPPSEVPINGQECYCCRVEKKTLADIGTSTMPWVELEFSNRAEPHSQTYSSARLKSFVHKPNRQENRVFASPALVVNDLFPSTCSNLTPGRLASGNPARRQSCDGERRAQSSAPSERTRPASDPHLL